MKAKLLVAMVLAAAVTLVTPTTASAAIPLTQSQPFQAVCEAQGGTFEVAIDFRSLYCLKSGGLFTAFTESQLLVQRTICEQVYAAFFGVQGEGTDSTRTFCSVAT
jgi:hypothetical protein